MEQKEIKENMEETIREKILKVAEANKVFSHYTCFDAGYVGQHLIAEWEDEFLSMVDDDLIEPTGSKDNGFPEYALKKLKSKFKPGDHVVITDGTSDIWDGSGLKSWRVRAGQTGTVKYVRESRPVNCLSHFDVTIAVDDKNREVCLDDCAVKLVEPETIAYKLCRVENGKFVSVFAGDTNGCGSTNSGNTGVKTQYSIGSIVSVPGTSGIYCYETKERAIGSANNRENFWRKGDDAVVLKVAGTRRLREGDLPRFESVKVLEKVWDSRPELKVGDYVKMVGLNQYISSFEDIGKITGKCKFSPDNCWIVNDTQHMSVDCLQLVEAPEPEYVWKDVTPECTIKMNTGYKDPEGSRGRYITVSHEGQWLLEMGLETTRQLNIKDAEYMIKVGSESAAPGTFTFFKILHRELK
jgi:hypothetical protein